MFFTYIKRCLNKVCEKRPSSANLTDFSLPPPPLSGQNLLIWLETSAFPYTNNFEFWDQICLKSVFLVENEKSKHH